MDVNAQAILVNNKDILRDQEKQRHELDGEAYAAHKTWKSIKGLLMQHCLKERRLPGPGALQGWLQMCQPVLLLLKSGLLGTGEENR